MSGTGISSTNQLGLECSTEVQPAKRLVYVEPEASGHHLAVYAAAIWERMIGEGWTILWLTSEHAARTATATDRTSVV